MGHVTQRTLTLWRFGVAKQALGQSLVHDSANLG